MTTATETPARAGIGSELPAARLYLLRAGYALIGVGLALVKWPLLQDAHTMPLSDGVALCLLTAMSVLALVGLRYPVKLLPLLLFETLWKVLWLCLVALPQAIGGSMSEATTAVAFNCALVVVVIAVIPWRYVWTEYVRRSGNRWRS